MHHILNLSSHEMSTLCIMIAGIALFLAIILTVIHYTTRVMAGFLMGLAAGTHGWWPMMTEWARDVAIPLLIGIGSLLLWALSRLYQTYWVDEVMGRF